jgi:hypothetical protein
MTIHASPFLLPACKLANFQTLRTFSICLSFFLLIMSTSRGDAADTAATASGASSSSGWERIDEGFKSPPNEYRLLQYSRHDGALLPLDKMREYGIGGVMLFMQSDGYLRSDAAWENVKNNIRQIKAAGMQLWMADDNGYPSAMAGGLVVEADPAFEVRCLTPVKKEGEGTREIRLDLPPKAEAFVAAMLYPVKDGQPVLAGGKAVPFEKDHVVATGLEGPWVLYGFAREVNNEGTQAMQTASGFQTSGRYPNLLNAAAMEKFVAMTHAEYERRLGPLAGQIDVFYSNEPNLMSLWFEFPAGSQRPGGVVFVPWDDDLPRRFKEAHGYELVPVLPALFGGNSDEDKLVRLHFYQTVASTLADNFSGRIARWADQHGIRSSGHPLMEESMIHHVINEGDFFEFVGRMQIPACDFGMPERGAASNYWMPKLLSSIARLHGHETVAGLLDPMIFRKTPDLTPPTDEMRRHINTAFLAGLNQISTYTFWNEYKADDYRNFNEYLGRLSLVLRGAEAASPVAMYYPIETFQAGFTPSPSTWDMQLWPKSWKHLAGLINVSDSIAKSLVDHGYNFSWLNGKAIESATIRNGRLVVGPHEYTELIMPAVEVLPLAVANKLAEWQKAGGKVLWVNSRPRLGSAPGEHEAVREAFASAATMAPADVVGRLGPAAPDGFRLRVDKAGDDIFIGRFMRDGRRLNFVINNSAAKASLPFSLEGAGANMVQVFNPADGSITERQLPATLEIEPSSSLFVVEKP